MTEAKQSFTPGPWQLFSRETTFEIISHDGVSVLSTSWHSRIRKPYPLKDEALANARLGAAAPDLLEALRGAVEWMSCVEGHLHDAAPFKRNLATYQAAIAKATGAAS